MSLVWQRGDVGTVVWQGELDEHACGVDLVEIAFADGTAKMSAMVAPKNDTTVVIPLPR